MSEESIPCPNCEGTLFRVYNPKEKVKIEQNPLYKCTFGGCGSWFR
ncbi:hypothetical protein LCGC14_2395570, partial [marine sediment metagenome]